ncbi:MAG TPA: DUF885 domain-containing protein, partial [Myxococcota bacterium]|nr:DUF885 domain-containing protein [Myxococcota bacterium]
MLLALVLAAPQTDKARFDTLIHAEWEWLLEQYPELATDVGDARYDDRLVDLSPEAVARRKAHPAESLKTLRTIDRGKLDAHTQLDYDVLAFDLETNVGLTRFPTEYLQIDHIYGTHTALASLAQTAPHATVKHYENFLKRMEKAPAHIAQSTKWLEKGALAGITMPRIIIERVPALVRQQTPKDPKESPVYSTLFANMPNDIAAADQARLRERALTILREQLYPAYTAFADYIEKQYLPRTRTAIGWTQLPDGEAWYVARIRDQTSLTKSADEIHELGLREVARIRAEMERAMAQAKFTKGLPAFFGFLRTDKRFFYTDKADLMRGYSEIAKRIDGELPRLFGKLPRLTYGVKPIPAYAEKVQTTAYYQPGSGIAGRSGTFFCNTYDLASRPKWEMEALTAHEAVPGHHLQIALGEEVEGASEYRKHGFNNAYVEGWALYSESLGDQLGLYRDPYSKFGQLTYEMWRAIRLVVDTGMHAKGWSRERAIQFFKDNTGKTPHDIEVEVDRYIAWPAQALGYKLGELKIRALRAKAQEALGDS